MYIHPHAGWTCDANNTEKLLYCTANGEKLHRATVSIPLIAASDSMYDAGVHQTVGHWSISFNQKVQSRISALGRNCKADVVLSVYVIQPIRFLNSNWRRRLHSYENQPTSNADQEEGRERWLTDEWLNRVLVSFVTMVRILLYIYTIFGPRCTFAVFIRLTYNNCWSFQWIYFTDKVFSHAVFLLLSPPSCRQMDR